MGGILSAAPQWPKTVATAPLQGEGLRFHILNVYGQCSVCLYNCKCLISNRGPPTVVAFP